MASTSNPAIPLTTIDGITRSLDDWTTTFRQLWIVLPSKAEAQEFIPVAQEIFKTFGDSDARCAYLVPGNDVAAKNLMDLTTQKNLCFIDPEFTVCDSLGITHAPSLIYLNQDTTIKSIVQGFELSKWIEMTKEVAKSLRWTAPSLTRFSDIEPQDFLIK